MLNDVLEADVAVRSSRRIVDIYSSDMGQIVI